MNDTADKATNPKKQFAKEVQRIEGLPQTQRWRAIKKLCLKHNPELREYDKLHMAEVSRQREVRLNDFASNKTQTMRHLMMLPEYLYLAIKLMDPEFEAMNDDPVQAKPMFLKMARTFPEYSLARKI
jgi:hypothetical protein